MSDAVIDQEERAFAPRGASLRDWLALHTWTGRRRATVAAAIAAAVALGTGAAGIELDLVGMHSARRALADAERGLAEAQRAAGRLPSLQQAVSAAPRPAAESTAADDVRRVSELTSASGLLLATLEPLPPGGAGELSFRPMKLVAQGKSVQVRAFLAALAGQPKLIVPEDLAIQRDRDGVSLAATLQVFDRLPPTPLDEPRDPLMARAADPFGGGTVDGPDRGALRLTGVMEDGARRLALIETESGTEAVQTGQAFAGGRVARVALSGVVIALQGGQSQTVGWQEERK